MDKIIPVVLCGGAGSRLWPVSRELHPKPFIQLADGQSLLQKAFLRGASLPHVDQVCVVTNADIFFKVEDELQEVNEASKKVTFVLEPEARNTAAAIAIAALSVLASAGTEGLMLVLPADHLILEKELFQEAVEKAASLAQMDKLVTFGIQPTGPETGYGYIEADNHSVVRFIEKPPLSEAEKYVASGRFFWNSGMFCFKSGVILREMEKYCPDIVNAARVCMEASLRLSKGEKNPLNLDAQTFGALPSVSIDYAVMEKSDAVAIVPCDMGWRDIGSWDALGELSLVNEEGNSTEGSVLLHDTENCFIQSHDRMVAALGVKDLIIVDTPDAVLVANKNCAQDVRHLYAQLKTEGHEAHRLHRTVHRPWGTYTVLQESTGFKIKRIEMKPGASLSLQTHQHRSEHWIVVSGTATVINGDDSLVIKTGESTFIPAGNRHRLSNFEESALVIVEVQCGDYLGEDDIVRLEDVYGRV